MSDDRRPLLPTSRYAWLVGIAAAVLVAGSLVIGSTRPAGPGAGGLPSGAQAPPFAVVLATSDVVCDDDEDPCDANVARKRGQGEGGSRPACEVRGPAILNLCELTERGPLVLGLMATRDAGCVASFDALEALPRRYPGLQVAVVSIRGELEDLREVIRARRWTFAVGWDRDGALASLYGVATCPYVVAARWRGRVQATLLGTASGAELERQAERVGTASGAELERQAGRVGTASGAELERQAGRAVAASRAAGWRP